MEAIIELFKTNWAAFCITLFAIAFAIKEIIEIISYFKKKFRIKTGSEEDKETLEERIATLEKHDNWQYNEISKIFKCVNEIKDRILEKEISDMRWEIINVADKISNGKLLSKECCVHCIHTYEKYEKIIEDEGLTNGEVEISIQIVNEYYKQKLKEGF